jgi:glycyl-tRNA synthetase
MDKIVSLCRRRGFVFPSSEIYGDLGSTYDYGHFGVLLKNNIRARWLEALVQEREDTSRSTRPSSSIRGCGRPRG